MKASRIYGVEFSSADVFLLANALMLGLAWQVNMKRSQNHPKLRVCLSPLIERDIRGRVGILISNCYY